VVHVPAVGEQLNADIVFTSRWEVENLRKTKWIIFFKIMAFTEEWVLHGQCPCLRKMMMPF